MKKRIIASIIVFLMVCGLVLLTWASITVASEHNYTKEELVELIENCQTTKKHASTMVNSARALGWSDDSDLIKEIKGKWTDADTQQKAYQEELDRIIAQEEEAKRKAEEEAAAAARAEEERWAIKAAEYPAATQIWRYMKSLGWNDYVCAGIMGNLMAEVGGQTLDIRYSLSSNGYYGMCQWNRAYSSIWGAGLESQCDYLRDTIKYEIDTYGFKYQKGFNFNSFLNMTDAQQAALAFAKAYERCGSSSYSIRQSNAIKAYNYFVN